MKGLILSAILLMCSTSLFATEYKCSEWSKRSGITCIFAGSDADSYERQCENACWYNSRTRRGNMGPNCQQEKVCFTRSPKNITECSEWVRQRGTTCRNPSTGRWEDKWARACVVGINESWCSDEDPNEI